MSKMWWKGTIKKVNESALHIWNRDPNVGKWIQAKLKAFMAFEAKSWTHDHSFAKIQASSNVS